MNKIKAAAISLKKFSYIFNMDFTLIKDRYVLATIIYIIIQLRTMFRASKNLYGGFISHDIGSEYWYITVDGKLKLIYMEYASFFIITGSFLILLSILHMVKSHWNNNSAFTLIRALKGRSDLYLLKLLPTFVNVLYLWFLQLIVLLLTACYLYWIAPMNTFTFPRMIQLLWSSSLLSEPVNFPSFRD